MATAMGFMLSSAQGFAPFGVVVQHHPPLTLQAAGRPSSTTERTQPVQPKTKISEERRQEAIKAMKRKKVETALDGVDAQMLEMLSDGFLYPNRPTRPKGKPKGRPDFVPGAMNRSTMADFQARREIMDSLGDKVSDKELDAITAYINDGPVSGSASLSTEQPTSPLNQQTSAPKKRGRKPKGESTKKQQEELPEASVTGTGATRKRKRVVKNLPEPKDPTDEKVEQKPQLKLKGKAKANNMELKKYYTTELLTREEEYVLGTKVQFMVKCEHVHEGLSINLGRPPTIEEWAQACGFVVEDPTYFPMEGDNQIRPAGYEDMFKEVDPNMFVGNGLAQDSGPGRGRGRVKKPPPTELKDFYDNSQAMAAADASGKQFRIRKADRIPINRGTTQEFIEMMMEAREAKQRMVQGNMRLVVSIARKYSNVGVGLQDLVQEGSLGLSRAAEKFDPSKGFKFSTYASWWIQQAVFRSIAYQSRTIRLPVHVHNLLNKVRKVRKRLEGLLGRSPTNEEMATELDMSLSKYNKMIRLTRRSISLELPKYQQNPKDMGHQGEDLLGDTIATGRDDVDDTTPEKQVDRALFHDDLKTMLEVLDEDEKKVICYRYGLTDGLTRTVTAVAAEMKESKAWVRSLECRALRKLRRPWYEKKLKEHQDALSN